MDMVGGLSSYGRARGPPRLIRLLLVLHPDGDAAIQRCHVEEDVEALSVLVGEGDADLGPFRVFAVALADAVSGMARLLRGLAGGFRVRALRHVLSPFDSRPRPFA